VNHISNIYDINSIDKKEHFLKPLLLLAGSRKNSSTEKSGFIELNKIYNYLQGFGYTPSQIDVSINTCIQDNLLEVSGRIIDNNVDSKTSLIRTTTLGLYHIDELTYEFTYIDAMTVDTPILDKKFELDDARDLDSRLNRVKKYLEYLTNCWVESGIESDLYNWMNIYEELIQNIDSIELKVSQSM